MVDVTITRNIKISNQYCGQTFPVLIVPSDRLHLKLTGSTPHLGRKMVVHSVPTALPLLLTLSDSLLLNFDLSNKSDVRFLASCIQPLVKVMCCSNWSLVVRKRINHTLSNVLWILSGFVPDHALKEALGLLWEGKDKEAPLTEAEFMRWLSKRDFPSVWCGLLAAGYDFNFNRLVIENTCT